MNVFSEYDDGRLTIYLKGELDHHGVKASAGRIDELLSDYMPSVCVLDFGQLSFMDSSGIALILRLYRAMERSGGAFSVAHLLGQPLRVVQTAELDRILTLTSKKEIPV